ARVLALMDRPKSRAAAAIVLARTGGKSPKAVAALIEAFRKLEEDDRQELDYAFAEIGKPAVAGLLKLFEDAKEKEPVRLEAARILGQMGEDAHEARPALEKYLKDPSKQVRWRAAVTLAHLQSEADVVPLLLEAMKDERLGPEAQSALGALGVRAK